MLGEEIHANRWVLRLRHLNAFALKRHTYETLLCAWQLIIEIMMSFSSSDTEEHASDFRQFTKLQNKRPVVI